MGRLDAMESATDGLARGRTGAEFIALAAAGVYPGGNTSLLSPSRSLRLDLEALGDHTRIDVTCFGYPALRQWGGRFAVLVLEPGGHRIGLRLSRLGTATATIELPLATILGGSIWLNADGEGEEA